MFLTLCGYKKLKFNHGYDEVNNKNKKKEVKERALKKEGTDAFYKIFKEEEYDYKS